MPSLVLAGTSYGDNRPTSGTKPNKPFSTYRATAASKRNSGSFSLVPRAKQQQLKVDFEAYLDGFSPNVQKILDKFKFRNQIPTLVEADILGGLIEKFLDRSINLSPAPVLIATYIGVLTNRKPPQRRGKVQLIDATAIFQPLRKNLGKKNCEFSDDQVRQITDLFLAFEQTEQSKVFPNEEFGYWKITVERPLRLITHVTPEKLAALKESADKRLHKPAELLAGIAGGGAPHMDFNAVKQRFEAAVDKLDITLRTVEFKNLYSAFTTKDPEAKPVIKKKSKNGVEYEPDPELRDTEQVPL